MGQYQQQRNAQRANEWQRQKNLRKVARQILRQEQLQIIYHDNIESIGEQVITHTLPRIDVNQGDVLIDPKRRYIHPRYDSFMAYSRNRLNEIMTEISLQTR